MDKVICVGKNYLDHALELGDQVPEKPILFLKPPSTVVQLKAARNPDIGLDLRHGAVNYELELVFRTRMRRSKDVESLSDVFDAFTLGLDLTKRELQSRLKKDGHPWEIAKVFPNSSLVGPWRKVPKKDDAVLSAPFSLLVNGKKVQQALGTEMRSSPLRCYQAANEHFVVRGGDLLFTGTPAGVGSLRPGDVAELCWEGEVLCAVKFTSLSPNQTAQSGTRR